MKSVFIGLAVMFCIACARPRAPVAAVTPARVKSPEFVLLRADAQLHVAPDERAPAISASRQLVPIPASGPEFFDVYRLITDGGAWLEVESLGDTTDDRHCESGMSELTGLRLRFFVHRDQRVPVTSQEVRVSYPDGTAITLAPGVPLWPYGSTPGWYWARHDSLSFAVKLPNEFVGWWYRPGRQFRAPDKATRMIATRAATSGALRFGVTGAIRAKRFYSTLFVTHEQSTTAGVLATVPHGCVEFKVLVPVEDLFDSGGIGMLVGRTATTDGPFIRRGARVFWASGESAGEATQDFQLDREIEPQGGRRCFEKSLGYRPKTEAPDPLTLLRLCVAAADVR